jgi:preprotein translocase subunit SecG
LIVVHVIVAVALVLIVLLQAGKGAGIGAAFGGASQTVFGPRGPGNFLSKLTTAAALIFMGTSLVLAVFSSQHGGASIVLNSPVPAVPPVPPAAEQVAPPVANTPEETASPQAPPAQSSGSEMTPEQKQE